MPLNDSEEKVILSYMHERDVPSWYRGTSTFQIEAADQLANAIRDDSEQNTTHRVQQCLVRLGLSPAVHDKDLKILMNISGGNDLAFLWFLMELYYKTKGDKYNSLNEQLILSSIAHLDMITTLRELNRILPPGHASKRQIEMRHKQKLNNICWSKPNIKSKLMKKHSSPYFDRLERPRRYGKPLHLERPDYKVQFPGYDAYKNPNYKPPNEANRWYANHKFRTGERITKHTIRNYLTELMQAIDYDPKSSFGTSMIINTALENIFNENEKKILCAKHRQEEEGVELRLLQFFLKKRQKCFESLELFKTQKQARLENIRNMLEKDTETYRLHYRQIKQPHLSEQTKIRVLGKDGYREYSILDDTDLTCAYNPNCAKSPSAVSLKNYAPFPTAETKYSIDNISLYKKNRLSFGKSSANFTGFQLHYSLNAPTPTTSQRYFARPTTNNPFKFDYQKIFKYKDENDAKYFIKDKCVEAMDGEPHEVPKTIDLTPDLRKIAKNCANQMWHENEQKWRADEAAKVVHDSVADPVDPYPPDMPRLPFYDCEDKELMDRMLKIALYEMRKQPKFVLASLPDSHKVPMLREWIYQRYGKRYTHSQQINELNLSIKIMNMLQSLKFKVPFPKPSAIGNKMHQNYGCHKYITKKINLERRRFYDRLNAELLKRTRYFWFAMRSSLCLLPQRQTFFAYLPSRIMDNYLFKPWKLNEFMDVKSVWEKRRHSKAEEKFVQN